MIDDLLVTNCVEKHLQAEANIQAKLITLDPQAAEYDGEEEQSRLLTVAESVGIITVSGGLTNSDSFWNRIFGMTAYSEIREACIQALEEDCQSIMFDYDTPGGRVSGMAETADFISNLPVPTYSYTSSTCASAGYFLACQSDEVYAGSFAEVGSVGVIVKTYDRSKMLADVGIKPLRFRSGSLKAVGDPDFAMSKKEIAYIEEKVQEFASMFYAIVSQARGLPLEALESLGITSGRTFIGQQAVTAQLVDKVMSFDEVLLKAYVTAEKAIDKRNNTSISY